MYGSSLLYIFNTSIILNATPLKPNHIIENGRQICPKRFSGIFE